MFRYIAKIVCIVAFVLIPTLALADEEGNESGLFLGFDTGYSFAFHNRETNKVPLESSSSTNIFGANVSIKAGYNFYFIDFVGLRGYLDYTFGFSPSSSLNKEDSTITKSSSFSYLHAITFNADLLVNIIHTDSVSFGAFAGIGLGYGIMKAIDNENNIQITRLQANGFILPINIGLNLTANKHHRFELGFKVPTLGMDIIPKAGKPNEYKTNTIKFFITSVGYSYIF